MAVPPSTLARMLSPKNPKSTVKVVGELLRLDQYNCVVDGPAFQIALDDVFRRLDASQISQGAGTGKVGYYPDLAKFLTSCVEECHEVLDKQKATPRQDRWYQELQFVAGEPLADRVEGSAPLKPDLTGGHRASALGPKDRFSWNPPENKPGNRLMIPVEVKNSWREIVVQTSAYARGLFSAGRPRLFALVLAFNQDKRERRFLVFHRGGLTASELCNIEEPDGLKEIACIFLTMASWSTPEHAGFVHQ